MQKNGTDALVLLAAGKELYKSVNAQAYIDDSKKNCSAVVNFMGLFMSHPYLLKRIENLEKQ